ncbi:MAG: hypothetical protein Q8P39_02400 [Candidatus Yanofskybacteria bacterium]|nr:hypothetical protein [Candidatus Yanofskybacteria bacterium]
MPIPNLEGTKDCWGKDQGDILSEFLKTKGITTYTTFWVSSEGKELPTGLESMGFWVLTLEGTVQIYSVDWDENKTAPDGSKGYYIVHPETSWSETDIAKEEKNPNYLRARKELGLPLTEEQERILKEANK